MLGVSGEIARGLVSAKAFTLSAVADKYDYDLSAIRTYSDEHLDSVNLHRLGTPRDKDRNRPEDMVPIVFLDDQLPVVDDEPDRKWGTGYRLSGNTVWEVMNPDSWEHEQYVASRPVAGGEWGAAPIAEELPRVIYVRAVRYPSESETVPDVHKADEVWSDHRHHQVQRNADGEFATEEDERTARIARRARRRGRAARRTRAAALAPREQPASLKELAASLGRPAVPRGQVPRAAVPLAQPKAQAAATARERGAAQLKATENFFAQTAQIRSFGQLENILGSGIRAVIDQHQELALTASRPESGYDAPDQKPHKMIDVIDMFRDYGTATEVVDEFGDRASAEHLAEAMNAMAEHDQEAMDLLEPPFTWVQYDPKSGMHVVRQTTYEPHDDEMEQEFIVKGSPEAMAAFEARDGHTQFDVRLVARNLHELAEHDKVNASAVGARALPIGVIEIALADTNPRSGMGPGPSR